MRVVHLSTRDARGGAPRCAHRLHRGLRAAGVDSRMLVRDRFGSDPSVRALQPLVAPEAVAHQVARREAIARDFDAHARTRPAGCERFSDDRSEWGDELLNQLLACDVVTVHWVAGLLDYASGLPALARRAPLVWRLADVNPLTGGCHYDRGCERFVSGCGACPQLGSSDPADLSRAIWERKRKAAGEVPPGRLHLVALSRWMAGEIARSLWRDHPVRVIPSGVDTGTFAPRDRASARRRLGIAERARVVLFVSTSLANERKGLHLLLRALEGLGDARDLLLVTAGHGDPPEAPRVPWLSLGRVEDDARLVDAYGAADLLALPSLQENLPMAGVEALACGTPLVGFAAGGIPDLVEPGTTGALAPVGDVSALAAAVGDLLASDRLPAMGREARRRALREHTLAVQVERYGKLYAEIARS